MTTTDWRRRLRHPVRFDREAIVVDPRSIGIRCHGEFVERYRCPFAFYVDTAAAIVFVKCLDCLVDGHHEAEPSPWAVPPEAWL